MTTYKMRNKLRNIFHTFSFRIFKMRKHENANVWFRILDLKNALKKLFVKNACNRHVYMPVSFTDSLT